jgi:hypothetical protein
MKQGIMMRYKIRDYGNTRFLVYTHNDGMEILDTNLLGLINTINAYNSIYHKEEI